jgi:hypothetical protein
MAAVNRCAVGVSLAQPLLKWARLPETDTEAPGVRKPCLYLIPDYPTANGPVTGKRVLMEAVAATAQAIPLTLGEPISHAGAFSRQTLRSRLEVLSSLESLFVQTVSQTASSAAPV